MKHWRAGVPSFLVGLALSLLGEVAAGLLLYGGPGFLPALSIILATLLAALAAGAVGSAGGSEKDGVDQVRQHWVLLLVATTVASGYALAWEAFGGFGAGALGQGLGLAVLAAVPYYLGGRVLAFLAALPGTRTRGRVAATALGGAATGVLAVGYLLFPIFTPGSATLLALAAVAAGARFHGWALDDVPLLDEVHRHVGAGGVLELETWVHGRRGTVRFAVRENGRLRALLDREGVPVPPEDRAARELLLERLESEPVIVSVGLGAVLLVESLRSRHPGLVHRAFVREPDTTATLLERVDAVTGAAAAPDRSSDLRRIGALGPDGLPESGVTGSADAVVVDSLGSAATPVTAHLQGSRLHALISLARPGGVLLFGPLFELPGGPSLPVRFLTGPGSPSGGMLWIGRRGDPGGDPLLPDGRAFPREPIVHSARRAFLTVPAAGAPDPSEGVDGPEWPESVAGFLRVEAEPPAPAPLPTDGP